MASCLRMHRVIAHLDMDAFFASVEQRDNPALRGKPVIVGAPPTQRGVVCAASYEARKFGVRSAMPSATAGRLCPKGVFVRPRMDRYKEESGFILEDHGRDGRGHRTDVHRRGVPGPVRSLPEPEDADASLLLCVPVARQLKERIRSERGLTATIGIASNKLLAKIASDFEKPDGLTVVSERDKVQFLRPLPARVLYGVGRVTEQVLLGAGIRTVGDLQDYGGDLRALVGSFGPKLKQFALGKDDRPLSSRRANVQRETLNFQRGHRTINYRPSTSPRRLHDPDAPTHGRGTADGGQGHVSACMSSPGAEEACVTSLATPRSWSQQPARANGTAVDLAVGWVIELSAPPTAGPARPGRHPCSCGS